MIQNLPDRTKQRSKLHILGRCPQGLHTVDQQREWNSRSSSRLMIKKNAMNGLIILQKH
jgi:hypothetical protein